MSNVVGGSELSIVKNHLSIIASLDYYVVNPIHPKENDKDKKSLC